MDRRERRYRTSHHVRRQARIADQWDLVDLHPTFHAHNKPSDGITRVRRNEAATQRYVLGRCKKTKALDCGHTRCFVCGYGKYEGRNGRRPTRQEYLSWFEFREQAADFFQTVECFSKPV